MCRPTETGPGLRGAAVPRRVGRGRVFVQTREAWWSPERSIKEILPFKGGFEGSVEWWVWFYWHAAQDIGLPGGELSYVLTYRKISIFSRHGIDRNIQSTLKPYTPANLERLEGSRKELPSTG
ncbi:Hypothetical protein PSEBR_m833 [Pseudomonas brassicacearum subsp. brassicacearum NFM421]|uniref:Uncharacterized protein n=1 Tax=Pseudomonas brassicacearum (strain NFM421) TaxID=994484 RepID=F2KFU1_PSEBN|nr:Hypothetical protein PSEBR_m833 [Pseudomonas brassicacearum subsp. brassicacearum NFM421]